MDLYGFSHSFYDIAHIYFPLKFDFSFGKSKQFSKVEENNDDENLHASTTNNIFLIRILFFFHWIAKMLHDQIRMKDIGRNESKNKQNFKRKFSVDTYTHIH